LGFGAFHQALLAGHTLTIVIPILYPEAIFVLCNGAVVV